MRKNGCGLLAVGYWLLAASHQLVLKPRTQKPTAKSQKPIASLLLRRLEQLRDPHELLADLVRRLAGTGVRLASGPCGLAEQGESVVRFP